jgi:hypothetical protein
MCSSGNRPPGRSTARTTLGNDASRQGAFIARAAANAAMHLHNRAGGGLIKQSKKASANNSIESNVDPPPSSARKSKSLRRRDRPGDDLGPSKRRGYLSGPECVPL